ncbi:hypothetical protein Snoj_23100 [Streptomyces nojiriensis]|uniref:DUF6234 domain-containing protein n=1 Tax=Streptomyces nojiriensis TaxID=66374 RepID=A0ABQ3SK63_9ACTN|nr:DUF6234 family protein [Streptomyces nojiriensis]QTI49995.1 hypothetical protein JYK04_07869 [Streptomyces nojiriensis]GGS22040.1 hypothetical protein GCM10010205_59870 [Streptomyces nojiriensis]GHI68392.1 hypothetical protein Snoj_23100 [Streptomyces nojiriensis]
MTDSLTEPRPRHGRRPWSRRTPLAADLAVGIPLLLLGAGWLALDFMLGHGMEVWAAQGDQDRIEAADLAYMARIQDFLVTVLVVAVIALVFRARWTAMSQLFAASLAGALLVIAQHNWDRDHPGPADTASEGAGSHYRENNGFRIPGDMSPASAQDAQKDADRIEPVLKRLWESGTWDPTSVRAALLDLGFQEERFGPKGEWLGGTLTVRDMGSRFETDHYVTPEGALVGVRVHDDACVTAFVQKTNYQVKTNGPYPEGGCFEPPAGH